MWARRPANFFFRWGGATQEEGHSGGGGTKAPDRKAQSVGETFLMHTQVQRKGRKGGEERSDSVVVATERI